MEKLNFLTAGIPLRAKDYKTGFETLKELDLNGLELEFVHGVRISDTSKEFLKNNKNDFILTAHAPFYINLKQVYHFRQGHVQHICRKHCCRYKQHKAARHVQSSYLQLVAL